MSGGPKFVCDECGKRVTRDGYFTVSAQAARERQAEERARHGEFQPLAEMLDSLEKYPRPEWRKLCKGCFHEPDPHAGFWESVSGPVTWSGVLHCLAEIQREPWAGHTHLGHLMHRLAD